MSAEDAAKLNEFIVSKRTEEVYILSNGALEAYLPVGHGSKELDKLIRLLAQSDFWEQLPQAGKTELEIITQSLLQDIVKGDGCPKVLGVNPLTEITTKDQ